MDIKAVLLATIAIIVFLNYIESSPFLDKRLRQAKRALRHWRASRERPQE